MPRVGHRQGLQAHDRHPQAGHAHDGQTPPHDEQGEADHDHGRLRDADRPRAWMIDVTRSVVGADRCHGPSQRTVTASKSPADWSRKTDHERARIALERPTVTRVLARLPEGCSRKLALSESERLPPLLTSGNTDHQYGRRAQRAVNEKRPCLLTRPSNGES